MGRILAVDIGNKRTGFAISDPANIIAMPLRVSENDPIKEVKKIIADMDIAKVIIGEPLGLSGKPTEQTQRVYDIKKELEDEVDIPIILVDERFTSRQARHNLSSIKTKKSLREKSVDAEAAAIILSTYLESNEANQTKGQ
jgi:putative Holliday junction resolvase